MRMRGPQERHLITLYMLHEENELVYLLAEAEWREVKCATVSSDAVRQTRSSGVVSTVEQAI